MQISAVLPDEEPQIAVHVAMRQALRERRVQAVGLDVVVAEITEVLR